VAALPGVDLDALSRWLDTEHPGLRHGELSGEVIAGGKSNLTYRITDGTDTWALRRPPLAHVLPTAHDMVREYRVINGLTGSRVPVADAVALCRDEAVLGAPFYLMAYVDGVVLDKRELLGRLSRADATRACELLVDTLLLLHEVDPEEVGLADFGRPDGFLQRQLRRWHQQWEASQTRPLPELAQTMDRLTDTLPAQSAPGIVHGDYRLTNVMFTRKLERIAAVVDWEMATLGDPLADVGLLAVYTDLAQQGDGSMPQMTAADGFLTGRDMVARYAATSTRSLEHIDWYVGFAYFKLAVISEGIHHRFLAGKTVGEGFERFGEAVPNLLRAALATLSDR
jgi:aminoglycoside phosphotransferase (APT) family kinase protein